MPGLGWPWRFGCGCGWAQCPKNARTEALGVVRRSSEPPRTVREALGAVADRKGDACWSADEPKARWSGMRRTVLESSDPRRATKALVGGVQGLEE